jgi:hypothetical protein
MLCGRTAREAGAASPFGDESPPVLGGCTSVSFSSPLIASILRLEKEGIKGEDESSNNTGRIHILRRRDSAISLIYSKKKKTTEETNSAVVSENCPSPY